MLGQESKGTYTDQLCVCKDIRLQRGVISDDQMPFVSRRFKAAPNKEKGWKEIPLEDDDGKTRIFNVGMEIKTITKVEIT